MKNRLESITLKGFKTIQALDFKPRPLTVLIGPNGVGKSNFVSFFRMMSLMLADPDNLQLYVGRQGGANTLLHDGPAKTQEIVIELLIRTAAGINQYSFRLVYAAGDTLIFADERYRFSQQEHSTPANWNEMGAGHRSPQLLTLADENKTARITRDILRKIVVYQLHNTSDTARIRGKWPIYDAQRLKEDAANLAPVLLRLRENESKSYRRIVDTIRLILPFFSDFEQVPYFGTLPLQWRERNSDQLFSVSEASDGMLRVVALITLLLLPERELPDVLILDEPELGLHPHAINVVGGLINAVSTKIQVIVATQSMPLVDCFDPEDIVVVEREGRRSTFRRLESEALSNWLDDYSLSELWEKNVLGGRP